MNFRIIFIFSVAFIFQNYAVCGDRIKRVGDDLPSPDPKKQRQESFDDDDYQTMHSWQNGFDEVAFGGWNADESVFFNSVDFDSWFLPESFEHSGERDLVETGRHDSRSLIELAEPAEKQSFNRDLPDASPDVIFEYAPNQKGIYTGLPVTAFGLGRGEQDAPRLPPEKTNAVMTQQGRFTLTPGCQKAPKKREQDLAAVKLVLAVEDVSHENVEKILKLCPGRAELPVEVILAKAKAIRSAFRNGKLAIITNVKDNDVKRGAIEMRRKVLSRFIHKLFSMVLEGDERTIAPELYTALGILLDAELVQPTPNKAYATSLAVMDTAMQKKLARDAFVLAAALNEKTALFEIGKNHHDPIVGMQFLRLSALEGFVPANLRVNEALAKLPHVRHDVFSNEELNNLRLGLVAKSSQARASLKSVWTDDEVIAEIQEQDAAILEAILQGEDCSIDALEKILNTYTGKNHSPADLLGYAEAIHRAHNANVLSVYKTAQIGKVKFKEIAVERRKVSRINFLLYSQAVADNAPAEIFSGLGIMFGMHLVQPAVKQPRANVVKVMDEKTQDALAQHAFTIAAYMGEKIGLYNLAKRTSNKKFARVLLHLSAMQGYFPASASLGEKLDELPPDEITWALGKLQESHVTSLENLKEVWDKADASTKRGRSKKKR